MFLEDVEENFFLFFRLDGNSNGDESIHVIVVLGDKCQVISAICSEDYGTSGVFLLGLVGAAHGANWECTLIQTA